MGDGHEVAVETGKAAELDLRSLEGEVMQPAFFGSLKMVMPNVGRIANQKIGAVGAALRR